MGNSLNELIDKPKFKAAIKYFNSAKWYIAHDLFEEMWHQSDEPERSFLQGLLQVSVAQFHLENGNLNGATILYGEGLGRLKSFKKSEVDIDMIKLCDFLKDRLSLLQSGNSIDHSISPYIYELDAGLELS